MKPNLSSRILLAGIAALAALSFSAYAGPRFQGGGCGCMGDEACIEARRQAAPTCPNADAAGCQMGRGMMNGPGHRHHLGCASGPNAATGCRLRKAASGRGQPPAVCAAEGNQRLRYLESSQWSRRSD
jgi:hypothetical protein